MILRHSLKIATYTTWYMYLYTKLTKVNTRALDILLIIHLGGIATLFEPECQVWGGNSGANLTITCHLATARYKGNQRTTKSPSHRTLTYFVRGSITVQLLCFPMFNQKKDIYLFGQIQTSQTGDQSYSDTSSYKVSEYSLS